jgi:pilus assembly protein Flp/PilA
MRKLSQFVAEFLRREDGPTAVEYAVMLALVITVCVSAVTALGANVKGSFTKTNTALTTAS